MGVVKRGGVFSTAVLAVLLLTTGQAAGEERGDPGKEKHGKGAGHGGMMGGMHGQGGMMGGGMMQRGEGGMCVPDEADFECWRESLGLSEEQVSTLKGIYRAFRKEHIMDRARMESTEVDLRALLDTGSVDLGKVENTMKEIEGHRTSLRMGHVRAWEKAKGVFTDEQRKKIGALPCNPSMTVLESCPSAPAPHGHGEAPKDQEEGAGGKPPGHPM